MAATIVVGVDGSSAAKEALRWGAEEARLRDARLVAVFAWTFVPPAPMAEPGMIPMPAMDFPGQLEAERNAAEEDLRSAVDDAFAAFPSPVEIERKLVEGDPAEVLEAEGKEADLVVVGSHGRSGIAAALLGSVSKHVVDHARCPVVVVKSLE